MSQAINEDWHVEELSLAEVTELDANKGDLPACIAEPADADTAGVPAWYGTVEEPTDVFDD